MSRGLRVNPPSQLPAADVSAVDFRSWQNLLTAYLEQDKSARHFLRHGAYESWSPLRGNSKRIHTTAMADPDLIALELKVDAGAIQQVMLEPAKAELLATRNAELSKFIALVCVLLPPGLTYRITQESTSFEWIFRYLEEYYGIRWQGAHFLKIDDIKFNSTDSPAQLFVEIHQAVADSLRKAGETVLFWNGTKLDKDEEMSPTLENLVVLWWLRTMDPRLVKAVADKFGHQMQGSVTLRDLQPDIAAAIPDLLASLDEQETGRSSLRSAVVSAADNFLPPSLSAAQVRRPGRGKQRPGPSQPNPGRGGPQKAFCRLCYCAGAQPSIYTSHRLAACHKLSECDTEDLVAALSGLHVTAEDQPDIIPGWDTDLSLP